MSGRPFSVMKRVRSYLAYVPVTLCLSLVSPDLARASSAEAQIYDQAVAARQQKEFHAAARLFEEVLRLNPQNADAQVLLGYSYLALDNGPKAQAAFEAALVIAPNYQDARLGLAQLAFRRDDRPKAARLLGVVLADEPQSVEALALQDRLNAPPPRKWRLDLGGGYHRLTAGRPAWREATTTLSYTITPDTVLSGTLRLAERGPVDDTQIVARLSHRVSPRLSFFGLVGVTPDPDFLPEVAVAVGGRVKLWSSTDDRSAFWLRAEARAEFGQDGRVILTRLGPQIELFGGNMVLSAEWLHGQGEHGTSSDGVVSRVEGRLSERLTGFIGYSDAPEIDRAAVIETRSYFVGLAYAVDDTLSLRVNMAREMRAAYDRNTLSIGLTKRF